FQWLIQVASGDRPHTRTTFISRSVFNPSPYRASPVVRRTEPASMREGGESRDRGGGAAQRRDAGGPDTRGGGHVAGLPQRQCLRPEQRRPGRRRPARGASLGTG